MAKKWAAIYANQEFVCVQTCSGLRMSAGDPAGAPIFLDAAPAAGELGQALQQALSQSRTLEPDQLDQLFHPEVVEKNYEDWVKLMLQKFQYPHRRSLFMNMKHCGVECAGGMISIRPMHHEKLEAWSGNGVGQDDVVTVAQSAAPDDLGKAALLALDRCTE